jgi:TRAP-type C4-dicarboxylate transport system permease small subunit
MPASATSIFLARLIGPVMVAIAVGMLVNRDFYRRMAEEALRSHVLIYLTGVMTMAAGLAIVLSHNLWAMNWRVLITLLGWLFLIGGAVRIVVPQQTEAMGRGFLKHPQGMVIAPIVLLALGAVLCFFGYR